MATEVPVDMAPVGVVISAIESPWFSVLSADSYWMALSIESLMRACSSSKAILAVSYTHLTLPTILRV